MGDLYLLQIINGFSWLLGFVYFITSAVFLDNVVKSDNPYYHGNDTSDNFSTTTTTLTTLEVSSVVPTAGPTPVLEYNSPNTVKVFATFSIWLSLFQLGVTMVLLRKLEYPAVWGIWWKIHLWIGLASVIIFSVIISQNAHTISGATGSAEIGFSIIDSIFCFATAFFVFRGARTGEFSDF